MYSKPGGSSILIDAELIFKKADISGETRVADLGCGASGYFVFPIARMLNKGGRVYAVDILKTTLEVISRRAKQENIRNIEVVWSNLEVFGATKIESGSLDAVLLVNILYQSDKRAEVLREAVRMLRKEGKMVVVEWKSVGLPFGPPPQKRVNLDSLKAGAQKLGLKLDEEFMAGHYHYGVVFSKL